MMRNKHSSSLQKTYDECFLICSTAIYFEGQDNEVEALRSWRSALDQIYYHNAYRVPANYVPRSETEKALKDSLRDMELQCKERSDYLTAIIKSREDADEDAKDSNGSNSKTSKSKGIRKSSASGPVSAHSPGPASGQASGHAFGHENMDNVFIGDMPIPSNRYDETTRDGSTSHARFEGLVRRQAAPALPQRPPVSSRRSSELAVVGRVMSNSTVPGRISSSGPRPAAVTTTSSTPTLVPGHKMKKSSRSPSPEKRTMLHTLRAGRKLTPRAAPPTKTSAPSTPITENPVTNRAATLAWASLGRGTSKDKLGRSMEEGSSTTLQDSGRKNSSDPVLGRPSSTGNVKYDKQTRSLVSKHPAGPSQPVDLLTGHFDTRNDVPMVSKRSNYYPYPPNDPGQPGAVAGSAIPPSALGDLMDLWSHDAPPNAVKKSSPPPPPPHHKQAALPKSEPTKLPTYYQEYPETTARRMKAESHGAVKQRSRRPALPDPDSFDTPNSSNKVPRKPVSPAHRSRERQLAKDGAKKAAKVADVRDDTSTSVDDDTSSGGNKARPKRKQRQVETPILADPVTPSSDDSEEVDSKGPRSAWDFKVASLLNNLPKGVDEGAAKQILNEIVVQGDEVHWEDVAGLEAAKTALKEAVVYPFLRPDLFMGLREPARGMLLFGPPGTGKTMLARAVATESRSTFFSISASSLTSKFLGESEKLVRALFMMAKALAPSIIFVDEIDSLLSARSSGEHEATRRIKTEFLVQWSDLQRAAAGKEQSEKDKERGDASRVLVLAATNLPWAIDEAARRRFVRRQYIPLPEDETRAKQLKTLLGYQKHGMTEDDIEELVMLTEGFSGSDITALAKDAAMGPLRSLGEKLLCMSMDDIRPISFQDFQASLVNIRPSVSKQGLQEFEDWAKEFGERGG